MFHPPGLWDSFGSWALADSSRECLAEVQQLRRWAGCKMLPAFWGTVVQSETIIHFCAPGVRALSPLCLLQGATTFRSDPLWLSGCLVSVDARAGLSFVSEEAFANAVSRALGKAQVSRWKALGGGSVAGQSWGGGCLCAGPQCHEERKLSTARLSPWAGLPLCDRKRRGLPLGKGPCKWVQAEPNQLGLPLHCFLLWILGFSDESQTEKA